ncbi:ATP-binding cassette domain-containing protein, partial [Enterococcus lactis]|uniref:ATP-binding cassette domain-containing protein n=1 Tax=Enterococcus lactis TaxID=357441 RepID=UPI001C7CAC1C
MKEMREVYVGEKKKEKEIQEVDAVDLTIEKGDVYGIVGYSGAGKSTLVRVMNLLQKPTAGEVIVNQTNFSQLSPK